MDAAYVKDLVERIAATFVVAFLGVYLVAPESLSNTKAAAMAGVAAAGSLIKGLLAKFLGNPETASLVV
jgi:ABC-type molybdate transport system substrate-binding protein